jgi:hypothetical protein
VWHGEVGWNSGLSRVRDRAPKLLIRSSHSIGPNLSAAGYARRTARCHAQNGEANAGRTPAASHSPTSERALRDSCSRGPCAILQVHSREVCCPVRPDNRHSRRSVSAVRENTISPVGRFGAVAHRVPGPPGNVVRTEDETCAASCAAVALIGLGLEPLLAQLPCLSRASGSMIASV